MQPKARWTTHSHSGVWTASLGVFVLYVETDIGQGSIYANRVYQSLGGATRFVLWSTLVPTPCDAADLMRLCEAELSRRLRVVADTLAGDELAPQATPPEASTDTLAVTSFAQLCDTLDALPPGLCIERAYVDGERPPQIWRRIGVDEYSVSLVRADVTRVRHHSRSQLQIIEYQSAVCRAVPNPTTPQGNI
jgi:hypothetical protein